MRRFTKAGIAGALALGLALSGCGNDGSSSSSGGSNSLTFWVMKGTNPDASAFYKQAKSAFKKKTGKTLKIQEVDWANAHDKLVTSFAGNTGPDVSEIGTTWTPEFAAAGGLEDLTSKIKDSGDYGDLLPALKNSATYNGKQYGVGWYAGVRSVVYRKDIYKKLGLSVPKSWSQLTKNIDTIAKKMPNKYAMPVAGDDSYVLDSFIWGAGGELAAKSGGKWKSQLDSPKSKAGISYYANLALKHDSSTTGASTWDATKVLDALASGKSVMSVTGNWSPKSVTEKNPKLKGKLGAFPVPGKDGSMAPTFVGGSNLAVMKQSKNQKLAWTFVTMMTTGKLASQWSKQTGYFPSTKTLLKPYVNSNDPLVAPFAKEMSEAGRNVPNAPQWGAVEGKKTQSQMMQSILTGTPIDKAVRKASESMTKTLNTKG